MHKKQLEDLYTNCSKGGVPIALEDLGPPASGEHRRVEIVPVDFAVRVREGADARAEVLERLLREAERPGRAAEHQG